jgi:hypothetical protein
MRNLILLATLFAIISTIIACSDSGANAVAGSPTEAYRNLYNAVKSKNTEAIKATMTKGTQEFVKSAAVRYHNTEAEVYANGLTASTFSETIPEMRDERIDGNFGALEVWNARDKRWEDLPFIKEDGQWKLAVGERFNRTYKSPGIGRALKEAEAANVMRGNTMIQGATPNPDIKEKIVEVPKLPDVNANAANTANKPVPQK